MMNSTFSTLPAEWERQEAVMVAWPHIDTDWAYMLDDAQKCFIELIDALSKITKVIVIAPYPEDVIESLTADCIGENVYVFECDTNDTWARDFGFITTLKSDGSAVANDFKFNGWGLKFASNFDNLINREICDSPLFSGKAQYRNLLNFVLEGGSIDVDDKGNLLTTEECLLSPNRNGQSTKEEIERYLLDAFGMKRCLWLKNGYLAGDDTDSHVDTLARFLPGGIIAYTSCDRADDEHFEALEAMKQELENFTDANGDKFTLIPLPIPQAIFDEDGLRLPATYANFLILNENILLPIYGDEDYDKVAIDTLSAALPDYTIIPINCKALIQQHGSLHCVTMQVPPGVFSFN